MLRIKRYIFISLFFIVSSLGYSQNHLPKPDAAFLKNSVKSNNPIYDYLKKYIGTSSGRKKVRYVDSEPKPILCYFEETFKKGIFFKNDNCDESGEFISINFFDVPKEEIVKLVDDFYKTFDNRWNKNKTRYEPIEQEAGCYLQIIQVSKKRLD